MDHEFTTGENEDIVNSYQESYSFIQYAGDRFGAPALGEFYRRVGRPRLAPGTWRYHVDRAMRGAFRLGYQELQDRWADQVVSSFGG
jgi:hypothetical protein